LPPPESYESANCGPNDARPGLTAIGIVIDPVPVTALAENFSPMPRIAPPPFGNATAGATNALFPPRSRAVSPPSEDGDSGDAGAAVAGDADVTWNPGLSIGSLSSCRAWPDELIDGPDSSLFEGGRILQNAADKVNQKRIRQVFRERR
jgi:hypothetical protein